MRATVFIQKGGVGKTTSAAHIGAAAEQDHDLDVLLIDLAGKQNDLATQFGIADEISDIEAPISAIFGDNWSFIKKNVDDVIGKMTYETPEGPDLIPADDGLGAADNNLTNLTPENRYIKLENFVNNHVAPEYDLVLFDLPGKGDNITHNGLFAAENVVVPIRPGAFERDQLDGGDPSDDPDEGLRADLDDLRDQFADTDGYNATPEIKLIFPTMVDGRISMHENSVRELREDYPDLMGDPVKSTANIGNEQSEGRTLFALDDDDLYSSGITARESYRELTNDLLERLEAR